MGTQEIVPVCRWREVEAPEVSQTTPRGPILPHEGGLLVLGCALRIVLERPLFISLFPVRHTARWYSAVLLPISAIYPIRCNNTGSREGGARAN